MDDKAIRVLMVTTEYPPMKGGVGRYTANLTKSLQKMGLEVMLYVMKRVKVITLDYHLIMCTIQMSY